MAALELFGTSVTVDEELRLPQPENDNGGVAAPWQTPAEALQWVRRRKQRLCRELASDAHLWACIEHRLTRTIAIAIERCARWQYYGERD